MSGVKGPGLGLGVGAWGKLWVWDLFWGSLAVSAPWWGLRSGGSGVGAWGSGSGLALDLVLGSVSGVRVNLGVRAWGHLWVSLGLGVSSKVGDLGLGLRGSSRVGALKSRVLGQLCGQELGLSLSAGDQGWGLRLMAWEHGLSTGAWGDLGGQGSRIRMWG